MITFPNAKINIGLSVTAKRDDGYHNLETLFYPLKACDALEILPGGGEESQLCFSGIPVDGSTDQNLVFRALRLLQQDFPQVRKPLDIFLHKALPMGAGIGGGSADAAFMLRMLNDHFGLKLDQARLLDYALRLGSDCPFFMINRPCLGKGRGELLEPVELDLSGYTLQLICPEIKVSTADAFGNIVPAPPRFPLDKIASLPVPEWREVIVNDFEASVFRIHPLLAVLKQQLYDGGALYASLSGTGSAVYGLFPKGQQAGIEIPLPFKAFIE